MELPPRIRSISLFLNLLEVIPSLTSGNPSNRRTSEPMTVEHAKKIPRGDTEYDKIKPQTHP